MGRTEDESGKESSKRVLGFRLANLGIVMGMSYFVLGIIFAFIGTKLSEVYEFPYEIFWGFLGTGVTSIGLTLLEKKK